MSRAKLREKIRKQACAQLFVMLLECLADSLLVKDDCQIRTGMIGHDQVWTRSYTRTCKHAHALSRNAQTHGRMHWNTRSRECKRAHTQPDICRICHLLLIDAILKTVECSDTSKIRTSQLMEQKSCIARKCCDKSQALLMISFQSDKYTGLSTLSSSPAIPVSILHTHVSACRKCKRKRLPCCTCLDRASKILDRDSVCATKCTCRHEGNVKAPLPHAISIVCQYFQPSRCHFCTRTCNAEYAHFTVQDESKNLSSRFYLQNSWNIEKFQLLHCPCYDENISFEGRGIRPAWPDVMEEKLEHSFIREIYCTSRIHETQPIATEHYKGQSE